MCCRIIDRAIKKSIALCRFSTFDPNHSDETGLNMCHNTYSFLIALMPCLKVIVDITA